MKLISVIILAYLTYNVNAKGLTMITRGCISKYLSKHQLLNVSFKIGPVPSSAVCHNVVKNAKNNVIDGAAKSLLKFSEESDDDDVMVYKECMSGLIERNNMTDVLLKNFMYREEKIENYAEMEAITSGIVTLYDYLCYPNKLQDDFNRKFTDSFAGYEKETNRFCLVNLLREKEVIDQDFTINFELSDISNIKCPEYINDAILNLKTEAFDLIYQNDLYRNETVWECAADERIRIGYVRAYYRLMAYTFSDEDDSKKTKERQKFVDVLYSANELASKCFKIGYEIL